MARVDTPESIVPALDVYKNEVHRALATQRTSLATLEASRESVASTLDAVRSLPARLRHSVTVPVGKHAFFAHGEVTHTNNLLVHLGDAYYAEMVAPAAARLLKRRLEALDQGIAKAVAQRDALMARLTVADSSLLDQSTGVPVFEIRSSLAESDALLATAPQPQSRLRPAGEARLGSSTEHVRSAAGYTYARLAPRDLEKADAAHESEELQAADAALQRRLAELMLLEAEQQQQASSRPSSTQVETAALPLQQQQQQHVMGAHIAAAEGAGAGRIHGVNVAAAPPRNRRGLVSEQQLQRLEAEPDSDDEDHPPPQQQQWHNQRWGMLQRAPPKPALKQCFLSARLPATASAAAAAPGGAGSGGGNDLERQAAASAASAAAENTHVHGRAAAFTGIVLERAAPSESAAAAGPSVPPTLPAQVLGVARPSKFKLQRMGLDEPQ